MLLRTARRRTRRAEMNNGATRRDSEAPVILDAAARDFMAAYADRPAAAVSLIIPAFNEAGAVATVIRSAPSELSGLSVETILVDDGSSDGTASEAKGAGAMVCRLSRNVGQGTALRLGYQLASQRGAQFIATADADGQFDTSELRHLLAVVLAGDADFANGSRRMGASHSDDAVRALGVVIFGKLISALTGVRITDPANGLRLWRRELTDTVLLEQPQYQTSELLIRAIAHGYKIVEVPVTVYAREKGTTKKGSNLRYGARFCKVIFKTWWSERHTARQQFASPQGLWRPSLLRLSRPE